MKKLDIDKPIRCITSHYEAKVVARLEGPGGFIIAWRSKNFGVGGQWYARTFDNVQQVATVFQNIPEPPKKMKIWVIKNLSGSLLSPEREWVIWEDKYGNSHDYYFRNPDKYKIIKEMEIEYEDE